MKLKSSLFMTVFALGTFALSSVSAHLAPAPAPVAPVVVNPCPAVPAPAANAVDGDNVAHATNVAAAACVRYKLQHDVAGLRQTATNHGPHVGNIGTAVAPCTDNIGRSYLSSTQATFDATIGAVNRPGVACQKSHANGAHYRCTGQIAAPHYACRAQHTTSQTAVVVISAGGNNVSVHAN